MPQGGCTCPPPINDSAGTWTHEWRGSCPLHGPYVRGGLVPSIAGPSTGQIFQAAHDALCGGGEEQYEAHHTHDDTVTRVLAAVTPLIEARMLRQAALMLRSNIGAGELADPGDRLDRWADNALNDLTQKATR